MELLIISRGGILCVLEGRFYIVYPRGGGGAINYIWRGYL